MQKTKKVEGLFSETLSEEPQIFNCFDNTSQINQNDDDVLQEEEQKEPISQLEMKQQPTFGVDRVKNEFLIK